MQNWGDFDTWDGAGGGAGGAPFKDKENKGVDTVFVKRERVKTGNSCKEEKRDPFIREKDKKNTQQMYHI